MMFRTSLLAVFTAALLFGCANDQSAEIERLKAEIAELKASSVQPLPASLGNYFPPKADAPIWRIQMHNMVTPLAATIGKVQAGDFESAAGYLEEFKKQFTATSSMVPEWTERFNMSVFPPIEEAVAAGDAGATMGAFGNLLQVCHNCHYENMVRVQQVYEWPKFSEITLDDPQMGEMALTDVMFSTEVPMIGIGISLSEGSTEQAREQFQMFKQGFARIESLCENCHESERTYFVDETVDNMIDRLGKMLDKESPDAEAVGKMLQNIGNEACFKCHLVHVPAAFEQKKAAKAGDPMAAH